MAKKFLTSVSLNGSITASSNVSGQVLVSSNSLTNEGGQIELALPSSGSTLSGTNVTIDVYQNRLRFFESGGTNRGFYIDISAGGTTVGTNLAGGSSYTAPTLAGTTLSSGGTIDTLSGTLTADKFATNNNGLGTNFKVGDDAWIGDVNLADTISIQGQQNSANGYIIFGTNDGVKLGRAGTGDLMYGTNKVWHAGSDGAGSGLDADTLDGNHASAFQPVDADLTAIAALAGTSGILKKTAADTWALITDNSTDWDSAYTDRLKWDGGSTGLTASTGRTSLGATTVGSNLFTLTNPSAITFLRVNADNTVSALDAATFRTAIGAGTSSTTGTVTSVSVASANGFAGSVATATTTPAITISTSVTGVLKGNGTAISAATAGTDYVTPSGTETLTNKTFTDNVTTFQDNTDNTKKMQLDLSSVATATTRTLTVPNVSGTIITTGDTSSVTNTMLAGSIANNKLLNSAITVNSASTSLGGSVTLYAGTTTLQTSSANQAMTGILSVTMPGSTSGTAQIIPPAAAGTGTVITLPGSTGTLALNNQTMFIGTTSVAINRSSASLALTGITSIDGSAGSVANSVTFTTSGGAAAGTTFNGSAARTIDYTTVGAAASGHNHSLDSLSNVTITSNAPGEILKWSGTAWINNTLAEAGIMSSPLTTTGDIIYSSSGTTAARLGIGTAGQALVVNSGATAPAWTTLTLENLPGAFVKKSVRVATTTALGGTYANGTAGVGATLTITSTTTLDGVTLANGDRILVKDQATTFQNGIYVRTSSTVLTRATDSDSPGEIAAAMVAVDEGTTNGGLSFDTDFKATDTIGTTAMTWNRMIDAASTFYIGTTAITAGRTSASQALTGITSIDGSAASVTNAVTFNNGGTGDASGTSFNGSNARTISYNSVGAAALSHQHSTGDITNLSTWTGNTSISSVGTITTGQWRRAQNPLSASAWGASGLLFAIDSGSLTNTSSSGTVAFQTAASIQNVIFASTNTVTVTDAATFYIASAPSSGTNTTITNSYPLYIGGGPIRLAPATSTTSSLLIAPSSAGAIKSSPVAGDIEFDGTRLLGTLNATTKQGKIGIVHAARRSGTASVSTTATSLLTLALPVESSTLYRFKAFIHILSSATTSSTVSFLFANAGTGATTTYQFNATSTGAQVATGAGIATTATAITDAVSGSVNRYITIDGFLTTGTSAGNLTPQVIASSGTWNLQANTYFEIEKIGTSSTTIIAGAWA